MSPQGTQQRAFTVIACQATGCRPATDVPVMAALAATIRRCPHGVLVASDCPLGPILCRTWHHGWRQPPGTVIVIQPCSRTDHHADGPATALGPVHTHQDLSTLCRWLETGQLDYGTLPARLRIVPPSLRYAGLN
ncbi:MAG TPA: hypothetical protein VN327_14890 [Pseudonocardiaceae bacterium]|jgi:hypothetical protein|nr:hypothetical protein [Pseudonocardiaceae bacterium]